MEQMNSMIRSILIKVVILCVLAYVAYSGYATITDLKQTIEQNTAVSTEVL